MRVHMRDIFSAVRKIPDKREQTEFTNNIKNEAFNNKFERSVTG